MVDIRTVCKLELESIHQLLSFFYHSLVYTSLKIDRFSRHQAKLLYFIPARLWMKRFAFECNTYIYIMCIVCIYARLFESLCSVYYYTKRKIVQYFLLSMKSILILKEVLIFFYSLSLFF